MMRFLLVRILKSGWMGLAGGLLIIGCAGPAPQTQFPADVSVPPLAGVAESVVFPAGQAADFVYALTGEEVQGGWTTNSADLATLDGLLNQYLADGKAESALRPFSEYKRQAAGYTSGGQKIILANYFCDSKGIDWKTSPLLVLDGGNCYFQVKFNRDTGKIFELVINGES